MQPLPNEQELIEQTKAGDKQAMSTLYEAYAQHIFQYISYRVESETTAEDLTADVFVRMIQGLPNYTYTGAPLGAWLFRIASNRVADYYRKTHQAPIFFDLDDDILDARDDLGDLLIRKEEYLQLRHALATLADHYQDILILRFMQNLSHAEVAEIMEKSEAAVRIMQYRALKALGGVLEGLDESAYLTGDEINE